MGDVVGGWRLRDGSGEELMGSGVGGDNMGLES